MHIILEVNVLNRDNFISQTIFRWVSIYFFSTRICSEFLKSIIHSTISHKNEKFEHEMADKSDNTKFNVYFELYFQEYSSIIQVLKH